MCVCVCSSHVRVYSTQVCACVCKTTRVLTCVTPGCFICLMLCSVGAAVTPPCSHSVYDGISKYVHSLGRNPNESTYPLMPSGFVIMTEHVCVQSFSNSCWLRTWSLDLGLSLDPRPEEQIVGWNDLMLVIAVPLCLSLSLFLSFLLIFYIFILGGDISCPDLFECDDITKYICRENMSIPYQVFTPQKVGN